MTDTNIKMLEVANNPPAWVKFPEEWKKVVLRGAHTNYGGAVRHYQAACRKYSIQEPKVVLGAAKRAQQLSLPTASEQAAA